MLKSPVESNVICQQVEVLIRFQVGSERNAEATAATRASQSPQQRTDRRARDAKTTATSRAAEPPAQRTTRRKRNADTNAAARAAESPAQRTNRQVLNVALMSTARTSETAEQRTIQLQTNANVKAQRRRTLKPSVSRWAFLSYMTFIEKAMRLCQALRVK
ncbi:Hypothetical predicted protein [Octopus vulgaris]|uniref:Uncharacterized protein n=1 Tax=Octopus vulgaris TaxID=6645 RepID=A0AA36B9K2_OCTVU|nr:Hypothetical predicted protein [Octopus vulgaris]